MERERFIKSFDGTELFTSSTGQGPAVVLCDGIGCDGFIWPYIKAALREHYQVISWHYRGHGRSSRPVDLDAIGMPALRADLCHVLDAYQVEQAVLLGHSMGVQVILDFALDAPEKARALVPICGSYGRPLDTLHGSEIFAKLFPYFKKVMQRWPRPSQALWQRLFTSRLVYDAAALFEVNGKVVQRTDFLPYFEHLAAMDPDVFLRMLDRVREHTLEDRLADIRAPTLIIAGERDTFTPAWLSHRMQTLIPDSELLLVPGGTHIAPIEIPELIVLRLQRFLERRVFAQ